MDAFGGVTRLELSFFRNIEQAVLEPHPGFNLIIGPNGAGKTNLLEALFFLAYGKSQRSASPRDFIRFGSDHFSVKASLTGRNSGKELRVFGTPKNHSFFINSERLKSASELIGHLPIISFSPEDLLLSSGPPSERRRYLNMLLSQLEINYFITLVDYNRTLAQRNACLKWSTPDPAFLSVLTEALIQKGAFLRVKRRELIETLVPHAENWLFSLTENAEALSLAYEPEGPRNVAEAKQELEGQLKQVEKRERIVQSTLFGPHLDDVLIKLNNEDARRFASRGQHRSLSLSLKLAAVSLVKEAKGGPCTLLLDDIFAELDEKRRDRLMSRVGAGDQIFVASPQPIPIGLGQEAGIFQVEGGTIKELHAGSKTQM